MHSNPALVICDNWHIHCTLIMYSSQQLAQVGKLTVIQCIIKLLSDNVFSASEFARL